MAANGPWKGSHRIAENRVHTTPRPSVRVSPKPEKALRTTTHSSIAGGSDSSSSSSSALASPGAVSPPLPLRGVCLASLECDVGVTVVSGAAGGGGGDGSAAGASGAVTGCDLVRGASGRGQL